MRRHVGGLREVFPRIRSCVINALGDQGWWRPCGSIRRAGVGVLGGDVTHLRIELFGAFRVVVDDRPVAPEVWSQRKPAALVKLLALAPGHRLRREQVMDTLWPDVDAGAELILSVGDLLCLPTDGLSVDVDEYWSLVATARRGRETDAYADAIAIYKDGLLPEDRYEDWAVPPRDELHSDWSALIEEFAGLLEARGDLNGAARAIQRLIATDPLREDNHARLMRFYTL